MNPLIIFVAFMLMRDARAIVELDCSDNATCIDNMAKEIIRSVRQQRTVKVFNVLTIEPLRTRQAKMARSTDSWLETFLDGNAFSFDWNDYTFKVSQADNSNALDLEVYQARTAKDVSDPNGKKSSSKNEEEKEEDKKGTGIKIRRKYKKKKVMQMIIPLLFGMKSAGVVMFAMAVVTVLTLKAFLASKLALFVTAGMAIKKLYETYGTGVGLQNQPYLYSQYPIDFPSASSHAYSASGVSPQFASADMYSPTAMGAQAQGNEIMHQSDVIAQQSQQAPTLLVNSTRAADRWDGKSKLQKFIEPLIEGVRNILDPIANVFYGAIPTTVRGLNSKVSTTKSRDSDFDLDELEIVKKPRQVLIPQPRNIAQRKMNLRKNRIPETSNVLWTIARYLRVLFGIPAPPLNPQQTMTMPMFVMPQMYTSPITMPPSQ
ncbi:unnamed protein product [Arctia plantaginis]|uniref:Uncharacterized protein n=1 Tax=Arctia plantaginis TaxID=874455 RepID=A0A8S1BCN9_ARCPL|nr:unnamed protein product [Arctia plantaginis]